jgi:hypothetical protein
MHQVWFEIIDSSYQTIGMVLPRGRDRDIDFNRALEFFITEMGLFPSAEMLKVRVFPVINANDLIRIVIP